MVKLESMKWWKWSFWIMVLGQTMLLYGIWKFVVSLRGVPMTRADLLPWLGTGLGVYLVGRGFQIAARMRARRLAAEAKAEERE
jgi:hypothetical protein